MWLAAESGVVVEGFGGGGGGAYDDVWAAAACSSALSFGRTDCWLRWETGSRGEAGVEAVELRRRPPRAAPAVLSSGEAGGGDCRLSGNLGARGWGEVERQGAEQSLAGAWGQSPAAGGAAHWQVSRSPSLRPSLAGQLLLGA